MLLGKRRAETSHKYEENKIKNRLWLGTFITAVEAAAVYNDAYIRYHVSDGKPNYDRDLVASTRVGDGGAHLDSELDTLIIDNLFAS